MAGVDPLLVAAIQADPALLARAKALAEKVIVRGEYELVYGEDGSLLSWCRTFVPSLREAIMDRTDGLDDLRETVAEMHAEVTGYQTPATDEEGEAPKRKRAKS